MAETHPGDRCHDSLKIHLLSLALKAADIDTPYHFNILLQESLNPPLARFLPI